MDEFSQIAAGGAGGNTSVAVDPVSVIVQAIEGIAQAVSGVLIVDKQRKAADEAFNRQFILTPEQVFGRYATQIDQTPMYLIMGFGVLILIALIVLATKKRTK